MSQSENGAIVQSSPAPQRSAIGALLRQPRFLLAAGVLLVCAVGFNTAAQSLQLHFRKQAVPLAVPALDDKKLGIPSIIGSRWIQISEDQPLTSDVEHALGTQQYVMRTYVDYKLAKRTPEDFKDRDPKKLNTLLGDVQRAYPEAIMRVGITYYTGLVDTVSHIPERCLVADGYQPTDHKLIAGPKDYPDGKSRNVNFRFITFEDITGRDRVTRNVGYFFHVNGQYNENPLGVRKVLQELFERYGYYAKVEMMTEVPGRGDEGSQTRSSSAMRDFIAALAPELERCLPDWQKVTGQPPAATQPAVADAAAE